MTFCSLCPVFCIIFIPGPLFQGLGIARFYNVEDAAGFELLPDLSSGFLAPDYANVISLIVN